MDVTRGDTATGDPKVNEVVRDCLVAIAAVAFGTLIRWLLHPYVDNKYPFSSLFLAVIIASMLRGGRAGFVAVVLSWMLGNYLFVSEARSIIPQSIDNAIAGGLFVFNSMVVVVLSEGLIRNRRRAESMADKLTHANAALEKRVQDRTEELSRTNAELKLANNELEGFTYSVSHDLRSPLRSIVATSMILQEELGTDLGDEHRSLLNKQATGAKKLAHLIDELLQLSRVSRHSLQYAMIDVSALSNEILDQRLKETAVPIQRVVQPGLKATADPNLLQLVFLNLVDNAVKFSPAGGTVQVGKAPTQHGEAFFVKDQGVGLDMKYISKLFKPFERLHKDTEFPGTGIGLANVHRIVSRHGGEVWVESELGKGTTVFFTLPDRTASA